MDSRFCRDSSGRGPGLRIRDVYKDERNYMRIDKYNPGSSHPFHISGKYGPLGWTNFNPNN
jgi:hypothetical protein